MEKPRSLAASGIDGLYSIPGGALEVDVYGAVRIPGGVLAIQNGTRPIRILSLSIDSARRRILGWTVLDQDSPDLGEPNHGVVSGGSFFFLGNSGWDRVNGREELETPVGAAPPVILRLQISPSGRAK